MLTLAFKKYIFLSCPEFTSQMSQVQFSKTSVQWHRRCWREDIFFKRTSFTGLSRTLSLMLFSRFLFFRRFFFFRKILRLFLSFKHSILMLINLVLLAWHEPFLQFSSYDNKLCFLYGWLYPFAFIYNVYSLFIDKSRISSKIEEHLELSSEDCLLKVYAYEDIQEELRRLGQMEKKIWVNHRRCFIPASNYMFEVNNRNSITFYEICSKLTIKTQEWRLLVSLLLTLSIFHNFF